MKLEIGINEYWIKNGIVLPSNFDSMSDREKSTYIRRNKILHRKGGPAVIVYYGRGYIAFEEWWVNGLLHRENGPAYMHSNGSKRWYLNGMTHSIDGPADINHGVYSYKSWYLNDIRVDGEIYKKIENSSKEKLLVYMVDSKYKDYLPLIEYRLNQ